MEAASGGPGASWLWRALRGGGAGGAPWPRTSDINPGIRIDVLPKPSLHPPRNGLGPALHAKARMLAASGPQLPGMML
jgi:hypothetical protein